MAGRRVLLLRADIAPPELTEGLRAAGASVTSVAAYRTRGGALGRQELERLLTDGVDIVTFTSSSTVTRLMEALNGDPARLGGALIAAIGPVTAAAAHAAGLRVDVEAREHTIDGLVAALVEAWPRERAARRRRVG